MQGIEDALEIAGTDTIENLWSFVEMQYEMADARRDFLGYVEAMRTSAEVGLAIYAYARNKEKICRG